MVAAKQIGTLADAAMAADVHQVQIIDPNPFSNPSVFANLQFPRELDVHPRFDNDAFTDVRTETPKHCSF